MKGGRRRKIMVRKSRERKIEEREKNRGKSESNGILLRRRRENVCVTKKGYQKKGGKKEGKEEKGKKREKKMNRERERRKGKRERDEVRELRIFMMIWRRNLFLLSFSSFSSLFSLSLSLYH